MKTINKVVLFLICLGGLAWAARESVDRVSSVKPQHFIRGIYIGTDSSLAVTDTDNKLTHSGEARIDQVFGAIPNDGGTGDACIISTFSGTIEGATVGDPCMVGIGFGASGVPVGGDDSKFNCFVSAANTTKVRRCGPRGMAALEDAGYVTRTFN